MLKDELCEKLNKLIDRSARYYGVNYNMPMKFSCGNRFDLLTATINEVAPYLKGAYLTTKLEFEKEGVKINNAVLKAGAKVVNVVIEDEIEDTVEFVSKLFNLPEDTRFIVYSDTRLNLCASYYASIKQIPLIFIPNSLCTANFALSEIKIKNGRRLDVVRLAVSRYILIDFAYIKKSTAHLSYAYLMSGLSDLVDYRINGVISNKPLDKFSYDLMRECVIKGFNIVSTAPEDRAAELLYNNIIKDLADGFIKNAYSFTSSAKAGYTLIKDHKKNQVYYQFDMSLKVLALLNTYLEKGAVYKIPDYNERSIKLSEITGIDQTHFLKNFMLQRALLKKKDGTLEKVAKGLQEEVKSFSEKRSKIYNTYLALGGKKGDFVKSKEFITALKYAGDTPNKINAMSLLREAGILELIDEETF